MTLGLLFLATAEFIFSGFRQQAEIFFCQQPPSLFFLVFVSKPRFFFVSNRRAVSLRGQAGASERMNIANGSYNIGGGCLTQDT